MSQNKKSNPRTLYLCYFWLNEPLVQSQVLPYLREIRDGGTQVYLLTFENVKRTPEEIESEREKLAAEGIIWQHLIYHKSPSVPATAFDVFAGARLAAKIIRREKIDVLHARVHVPALMAMIARNLSRRRPKILFDIRGFFPEEYTDAGSWKAGGWLYRATKRVERKLLRESDAFVVLTEKARAILFPESAKKGFDKFERPVEVIPCCVDLKRFETANENSRQEIRREYDWENRRVVVYVGSLGTWYLADEMADFMQTAREEDEKTFALILTQNPPEIMTEKLKARGFTEKDFLVKKAAPTEIPKYLSAADIALSFIKSCFSKLSSSPTKIAEYLASGVPVVTNRGVGDVAEQIEADKTGVVVADFSRESYLIALREIENLRRTTPLAENCQQSAHRRFDLARVGGVRYRSLYEKLMTRNEV